VVAIVAVTGTEDSVQDVIAAGAFAETLKKRRPKFCWMHDWKRPLGRILSITELKPGDRRLPRTTPDGRAWPAAAGALIATMQFNLRTRDGRDFYEHAKLWAEGGEAAFSIGYKVVEGMASKRGDGVRVIYQLDLYECSLVLHGAHDMALALEVKDADGAVVALEYKDATGMVLSDAPVVLPEPMEAKSIVAALARHAGRDGLAALMEAKSLEVKAGIPGVADTPSDAAAVERLRKTWTDGRMAAKVGWGTEGDFDRCVALASEYMTPEDAKGWCNLRHHDALGIYPATHAKLEGKSAPTTSQEAKSMAYMKGSQEERRSALCSAVEELLVPRKEGHDGALEEGSGWANIEATFDTYVIATRNAYRGEDATYRIDYSWDGDNITLGIPEPVELSLVAIAEPSATDPSPLDEGVDVRMRFIDPASVAIEDAARFIGALPEGKGLDELTEPVLLLLDAMAVKGLDVGAAVMGDPLDGEDPYEGSDYDDEEDEADEPEPDDDADDEDPEETEDDEDKVTLDPDAVRAQIAALRA
jgi:hypothetical protein